MPAAGEGMPVNHAVGFPADTTLKRASRIAAAAA